MREMRNTDRVSVKHVWNHYSNSLIMRYLRGKLETAPAWCQHGVTKEA